MVKSESKCSLKIGDKVKGVEFNGNDYPEVGWHSRMSDYIGRVGEVLRETIEFEGFRVLFEDGRCWSYPANLLKKVEDNETNKQPVKNVALKSAHPKSVWV